MRMEMGSRIRWLAVILAADVCMAAGILTEAGAAARGCAAGSAVILADTPEKGSTDAVSPRVAALTFDDGPNAKYTGALLDGLKERGVTASFFLLGASIEGNEELVRRMAAEGHLIGVHGMEHADLTTLTPKQAAEQIAEASERIAAVTGEEPEYMRPPYGKWNEALAEEIALTPVFWNVDSIDWRLKNTEQIVKKVLNDTKNGDIILLHDEFRTSVEAALQIVDSLRREGYTFVTVDELSVD